ncbi:hypothetical protein FRC05_001925 [Tulasnella sp. 425]|nr:hypothetical protein FRC05_001925 [Tulasnella sp. 425]
MGEYGVKVTYSGPILFLSSGQWAHTFTSLKERLPLRNLHWRSVSRPSVRSVQELDVELVSLESVRDEPSSQIPATLLERPLLNIYFVTCEDADTYKNSVRKQIRDWHTSVTQRKHQEWLICLVIRPDAEGTTKRLFQRGTLLDKIRADFNVPKRERCVQLAWSIGSEDPAAWTDLISKMKEGIISSFDANIIQREEEVKRSEVQRQMPGWNFCTFFILKESLATSFDGMNLTEDALIQYDELEASFFQVLKEKNLSWFGQLGGTAPNDDSAPLLSVTKKPYRELILSNTITVFDFRSYLLARQCFLLARLGQLAEAAIKAERFITSFARTLQENKKDLSDFFLESWIYSASIGVVNQCDAWADAASLEPPAMISLNAAKAELLDLARAQLDKVGIRRGYLPPVHPFSMSLPSSSDLNPPQYPPSEPVEARISSQDLIEALRGRDEFDRLYITTTNRTIQTYNSCNRRRFALKLHASLAALDNARQRYPSGHAVFASLPGHYVAQRWSSLEGFVLLKSMESYPQQDRPKEKEWASQAAAFLRAFVVHGGHQNVQAEEPNEAAFASMLGQQKVDFVRELVEGLRDVSLEEDYIVQNHPSFSVRLEGENARIAETEDGATVDVTVMNSMPVDVLANGVSVKVISGDEEMLFSSSGTEISLPPGQTRLSLSCPIPSSGLFKIDCSSVRVGKVAFQYPANPATNRPQKPEKETKKIIQKSQLLRLPYDADAFNVQLTFPDDVVLDATPHLMLAVHTGRNHVTTATLRLRNPDDEVMFDTENADACQGTAADVITFSKDCIVIQDVPPNTALRVNVPYSGVRLDTIKASHGVPSRFSGTHDNLLRFLCRLTTRPKAPTAFDGSSLGHAKFQRHYQPETLVLKLKYRPLKEEIESRVTNAINAVSEHHPELINDKAWMWGALMEELETGDRWQELLTRRGLSGLREAVKARLSDKAETEIERMSAGLLEVVEVLQQPVETKPDVEGCLTLSIPVDLPAVNILNAAHLTIPLASTDAIFSGQPLQAILNISTSFHWGSGWAPRDGYLLRFDIDPEGTGNWLISGQRRGEYFAKARSLRTNKCFEPFLISKRFKDNSTYETKITLVPLRDGALLLPKIAVTPITDDLEGHDEAGPSCETHQIHAAERVNVLPRSARSTYVVNQS